MGSSLKTKFWRKKRIELICSSQRRPDKIRYNQQQQTAAPFFLIFCVIVIELEHQLFFWFEASIALLICSINYFFNFQHQFICWAFFQEVFMWITRFIKQVLDTTTFSLRIFISSLHLAVIKTPILSEHISLKWLQPGNVAEDYSNFFFFQAPIDIFWQ